MLYFQRDFILFLHEELHWKSVQIITELHLHVYVYIYLFQNLFFFFYIIELNCYSVIQII